MKSNQENRIMSMWRVRALALVLGIGAPLAGWAQNAIQSINSTQQGTSEVVRIELSEPLAAVPAGFTIQTPPRIAIDLPGVTNALGRSSVDLNQGNLRSVNVAQAGERTRLVLNLKQAANYKAQLQGKALLLVLMRELVEGDGVPDRCLAALASAHPRVRLVAAQALEHFGDDAGFAKFVTELINDRGEGKTKWTIPGEVVRSIAELVTFGDNKGNPQLKVRAARLLDALAEDKQETFDRQWSIFSRRYASTITAVHEIASKRPVSKPAYAPEELRQQLEARLSSWTRNGKSV